MGYKNKYNGVFWISIWKYNLQLSKEQFLNNTCYSDLLAKVLLSDVVLCSSDVTPLFALLFSIKNFLYRTTFLNTFTT